MGQFVNHKVTTWFAIFFAIVLFALNGVDLFQGGSKSCVLNLSRDLVGMAHHRGDSRALPHPHCLRHNRTCVANGTNYGGRICG